VRARRWRYLALKIRQVRERKGTGSVRSGKQQAEQRDILSVPALAGTVTAARPPVAASCIKGRTAGKKMPQQNATAERKVLVRLNDAS